MSRALLPLTLWTLLAPLAVAAEGARPTMGVEERIFCVCSMNCGKGLSNCTCGSADWYRTVIAQLQTRGIADREIVERFVVLYGEEIRGSSGGLTNAVPIVAIALGVALVAYAGWRWRRGPRPSSARSTGSPASAEPRHPSSQDEDLVKRALEAEEEER